MEERGTNAAGMIRNINAVFEEETANDRALFCCMICKYMFRSLGYFPCIICHHHHKPTAVHYWNRLLLLCRSSNSRIQLHPAVLRKSSLHLAVDVLCWDAVSTQNAVYSNGNQFYGKYGHFSLSIRWLKFWTKFIHY